MDRDERYIYIYIGGVLLVIHASDMLVMCNEEDRKQPAAAMGRRGRASPAGLRKSGLAKNSPDDRSLLVSARTPVASWTFPLSHYAHQNPTRQGWRTMEGGGGRGTIDFIFKM